jgi:isopenicillin N synthase-like dioxygenase
MMASLPLLDLNELAAGHPAALTALHEACREVGTVLLSGVPPDLCATPVTLARRFFALDADAKQRMDIACSPHFRGFSVMHNERDWREQVHFGRERPARPPGEAWGRLDGPNLWPEDPELRAGVIDLLRRAEDFGSLLLMAIARSLGARRDAFLAARDDAYTLMKFICYHAQTGDGTSRRGVAAHCDFSWLTLLFQDPVGGLQVMDRAGRWIDIPAAPDLAAVNIGELLQFATSGDLFAAPHRVVNPSRSRDRLSVPVFINPPLAYEVRRVEQHVHRTARAPWLETEHVHRVLTRSQILDCGVQSLHFGHAEWRRKGENIWCSACCAA